MRNFIEVFEVLISSAARSASGISIELAIGRAGSGWAGPTVGRAKIGLDQNWPGFFGPQKKNGRVEASRAILDRAKFDPVFFGPII